jgi:hypothetical protein
MGTLRVAQATGFPEWPHKPQELATEVQANGLISNCTCSGITA